MVLLGTANTEGLLQIGELGVALVLSSAIGFERELRGKYAGLRTHTLVGVGAALFMLVSKYGFSDVLRPGEVVLDPSRMAAQIVTGIGFLGAGLIFVRSDAVRGLTTAASVWVTAGIASAAGAGLPVLAAVATAMYFLVVLVIRPLFVRLPLDIGSSSAIRVRYVDGRGVLRQLMNGVTERGFKVAALASERVNRAPGAPLIRVDGTPGDGETSLVEVTLRVEGKGSVNELAAALAAIDGVDTVLTGDSNDPIG